MYLPALLPAFLALIFVSFLNIHSPVLSTSTVVSSFIKNSTQKDTTHGGNETNEHGLPITSSPGSSKDDTANSDFVDIGNKARVSEEISSRILERQEMALSEYQAAEAPIHANEIGVVNPRNHTAIPCRGKRIALIGSSHGRSLAFSFAGALTGMAYATEGEEVHVPLFNFNYSAIPERRTCNSWELRKMNGTHPVDTCDLPEYQTFFESKRICRYTYDTGINVDNCGYPGMKRWALGPGSYYSEPSVPINHALSYAPDKPHLAQLYFFFKTWIYSPQVDEKSVRHLQAFRPDVLILDFSMWGCRSPDKLNAGRTDWPEDKARNCSADFFETIANWDRNLGGENLPSLVIHYVNSAIQPIEELNANLAAVKQLQQYSRTKIQHVLIDKREVVEAVDARILGHGFLGKATDIWARAALEVICQQ